jgi:hypothetical protein
LSLEGVSGIAYGLWFGDEDGDYHT